MRRNKCMWPMGVHWTKGWLRTNVHRKQNVLHKLKTKLFLLTGSENIIKGKRRKNSKWGSGCFIEVREGGGGVVRAVECMVMWSTWSWQKEQPEFVDINPLHPDISIHFLHTLLICFFWYWQEEFIWRSKLLMLAIISFIAMILMNGLAVLL